jgi:hypothetical protein
MGPMGMAHSSGILFAQRRFHGFYGTDTLHLVYSTLGYLPARFLFTSLRRSKYRSIPYVLYICFGV